MKKTTTWKNRILGCLSLSLITHLGLIAAAFILPGFASKSSQEATASTVADSTFITATEATPAMTEMPAEVTPSETQTIAANDPLPVKDIDVVAPALPTKTHAPKLATSLPEKHAKMIKDTADDADMKLKQALAASRSSEKTSRPEIASDIAMPSTVAQNNLPEQLQPDATFPEESAGGAVTTLPQSGHPVAAPQPAAALAIAPIQKTAQVGSVSQAQGPIRDGDNLKEVAGNTRPVYPVADRRAGRQGTVIFIARLTPDGQVINIRLERSSGSQTIDGAAYSAFRTYRYQNGQEGMIRKAFTFALKGEAVEDPVARR